MNASDARAHPRLLHGLFFLAFTLVAACSPRVEPAGPPVRDAALAGNAFVMSDGAELPYRVWKGTGEKPKAVILAVHGFNDYSHAFEQPASHWKTQDIWTYAYDQRGFGEAPNRGLWPGGETMRRDLHEISKLIRAKHPDVPMVVLGESMGAAVTLTAMTRGPEPAGDRFVLSAPAVWGRQDLPWYLEGPAWFFAHTVPWLEVQPRTNRQPSDNIEMLRAYARDPLVIKRVRLDTAWGLLNLMTEAQQAAPALRRPALILFGKNEELIEDSAIKRFTGNLPKERSRLWNLVEYDTGYHMLMRDLNAERVWKDIAAFALHGEVHQGDIAAE